MRPPRGGFRSAGAKSRSRKPRAPDRADGPARLDSCFHCARFPTVQKCSQSQKDWPIFSPCQPGCGGIGAPPTNMRNHSIPATLRSRPLHRESAVLLRQLRPHLLQNVYERHYAATACSGGDRRTACGCLDRPLGLRPVLGIRQRSNLGLAGQEARRA